MRSRDKLLQSARGRVFHGLRIHDNLNWAKIGQEPPDEEPDPQMLLPAINLVTLREEKQEEEERREQREITTMTSAASKEFQEKQEKISTLKEIEKNLPYKIKLQEAGKRDTEKYPT